MEPWICPRCQTVHAGWVSKCSCHPYTYTTASTTAPLKPITVEQAAEFEAAGRAFAEYIEWVKRWHNYWEALGIELS